MSHSIGFLAFGIECRKHNACMLITLNGGDIEGPLVFVVISAESLK